ncbi:MAG: hypothetical protein UX26_C0013G0005 [Parcubacteria group bacterium GW2011_GWC1_45_9]|nr:MAG: hypothetical protein UW85_C0001G0008 [Parcubacteria group bacterium GW2011_GWA1_Parcubacteria_45_10]KKT87687.1 MAG: hypothetical protein UW89_C0020G0005 [Parcubacteria group bacterium GW2011_GWB1_45_10]KKU16890.1 MAG: hypothetical protein UX26_C0013G0005 [Parcubacteria group bacterium GW2011_GWC1_45_9]
MNIALRVLAILILIIASVVITCALSPEVGKEISAMMQAESDPVEN